MPCLCWAAARWIMVLFTVSPRRGSPAKKTRVSNGARFSRRGVDDGRSIPLYLQSAANVNEGRSLFTPRAGKRAVSPMQVRRCGHPCLSANESARCISCSIATGLLYAAARGEGLSAGADATESSLRLGMANSIASLVLVALAPVLGAIADQGGAKKKFLLFFTVMGVVMTGALYLVAQGAWPWAVLLYVLASIGFAGGYSCLVALLGVVARREKLDGVAGLGCSLGYLGGGVLFAVN